MDYGTPTSLPRGVVPQDPNSFAPIKRISRHSDQFYELVGDLIIAGAFAECPQFRPLP